MRTPPQSQNQAPVIAGTPAPPPTPATPVAVQGLDGLAGQLVALQAQLAGLQAQQRDLRLELRRTNGVQRAEVGAQMANVSAQIANVNAQIAAVRADIGARVGIATMPSFPGSFEFPNSSRRGLDGDQVTAIFIVFMLAVMMPVSLAFARRMWRRTPKGAEPRVEDVIVPRLERLEQAVDAVAIEIERISESQRFVTRILVERPRQAASAMSPAPESAAEKPILALGAGPMENVRAPEREAARQVVTPH